MKLQIICTLFFISYQISSFCYSNILYYNITSSGLHIGELKAIKKVEKDLLTIIVSSNVNVSLFLNMTIDYKLISKFKNNVLIESHLSTYVNEHLHTKNSIILYENGYKLIQNDNITYYKNPIKYTGAFLYFFQPENEKKIFSEVDLIDKPMIRLKSNIYQLTNPLNNNKSTYYYDDHLLQSIEIEHTILNFKVTKK